MPALVACEAPKQSSVPLDGCTVFYGHKASGQKCDYYVTHSLCLDMSILLFKGETCGGI